MPGGLLPSHGLHWPQTHTLGVLPSYPPPCHNFPSGRSVKNSWPRAVALPPGRSPRSPLLAGAGKGPACAHIQIQRPRKVAQGGWEVWPEGAGGGWAGSSLIIRQMVPLAWGRGLALPIPPTASSPELRGVLCHHRGDKPQLTMHLLDTTLATEAMLPAWGGHSGQLRVTRSLPSHQGPVARS